MSALVEWRFSPTYDFTLASPTQIQWYDFLLASINSWASGADSRWEVASSTRASTPYNIVLKRKAGGAGRIVILIVNTAFTPRPNVAYPEVGAAIATFTHIGFFQNATLDTPAGWTGASGDFLGSDVGAVGFSGGVDARASADSSFRLKLFDHADAFGFSFQSSSSGTGQTYMAGYIVDDPDSVAVPAVWTYSGGAMLPVVPVTALSAYNVGGVTVVGGVKKPIDRVSNYLVNIGDLRDISNNRAYFLPMYASVFGEKYSSVAAYKLRQIAQGPSTLSGAVYELLYASGPVLIAGSLTAIGGGGANQDTWLVNFLT